MEGPTKVKLDTYLTLDGTCEAAFNFYQSILGGKLDYSRFKDAPPGTPFEPGHEEKIMHVTLTFDDCTLMGSDSGGRPVKMGDHCHLSVFQPDKDKAKNVFEKLAEGGQVTMPFNEVFWGGSFGMATDKFGVSWMVSCP